MPKNDSKRKLERPYPAKVKGAKGENAPMVVRTPMSPTVELSTSSAQSKSPRVTSIRKIDVSKASSSPKMKKKSSYRGDPNADRPFACTEPGCGKRFNRRFTLSEHMKTHTGDKPYACPIEGCGSRFSTSGNLSRHKRVHFTEKSFACPVDHCKMKFTTAAKLARHVKVHSSSRPFLCQITGCHKRFSNEVNLSRHVKSHEDKGRRETPNSAKSSNVVTIPGRPENFDVSSLVSPLASSTRSLKISSPAVRGSNFSFARLQNSKVTTLEGSRKNCETKIQSDSRSMDSTIPRSSLHSGATKRKAESSKTVVVRKRSSLPSNSSSHHESPSVSFLHDHIQISDSLSSIKQGEFEPNGDFFEEDLLDVSPTKNADIIEDSSTSSTSASHITNQSTSCALSTLNNSNRITCDDWASVVGVLSYGSNSTAQGISSNQSTHTIGTLNPPPPAFQSSETLTPTPTSPQPLYGNPNQATFSGMPSDIDLLLHEADQLAWLPDAEPSENRSSTQNSSSIFPIQRRLSSPGDTFLPPPPLSNLPSSLKRELRTTSCSSSGVTTLSFSLPSDDSTHEIFENSCWVLPTIENDSDSAETVKSEVFPTPALVECTASPSSNDSENSSTSTIHSIYNRYSSSGTRGAHVA